MEIERKWLIKELPVDLDAYEQLEIEQAYLSTDPVIRIRKQNDEHILTIKGKGKMAREEFQLPLTAKAYARLARKAEGHIIKKTRARIPLADGHLIELDLFHNPNPGLYLAEIEFSSVEEAKAYTPPLWFGEDVTEDRRYHNAAMSIQGTVPLRPYTDSSRDS